MPMKIGELSTASGTTIESIRFYEREGLIAEPGRTDGNYRVYGDEQVQRLVFIRRCRSLDMALDEIRVLLAFKDAPSADCGDVNHPGQQSGDLQGALSSHAECFAMWPDSAETTIRF